MDDIDRYKNNAEETEKRGKSLLEQAKTDEEREKARRVLRSSIHQWELFMKYAPPYLVEIYDAHVTEVRKLAQSTQGEGNGAPSSRGPGSADPKTEGGVKSSEVDIAHWIAINKVSSPDVKFESLRGIDEAVNAFETFLIRPYRDNSPVSLKLREKARRGFLLYGPPGCGKTRFIEALYNELRHNDVQPTLIAADFAGVVSKWVGQGPKNVKELFRIARNHAELNPPCIIFIDEIEALVEERGKKDSSGGGVLTQFLQETTPINDPSFRDVYVIGATNRPDLIDTAMRRRLSEKIMFGLPDKQARKEILNYYLCKEKDISLDVDFDGLASLTDGFSGAELEGVCETAIIKCLVEVSDDLRPSLSISDSDLIVAIEMISKGDSEIMDFDDRYTRIMEERKQKLIICAEKSGKLLEWKRNGHVEFQLPSVE